MRILLDEDVPRPVVELLRHLLRGHDVDHVQLIKWAGKKDLVLYQDAKRAGYDVVVTNDNAQMSDPDECREVKRTGMHRVSYKQRHPGLRGLAIANGVAGCSHARRGGRADQCGRATACFDHRH